VGRRQRFCDGLSVRAGLPSGEVPHPYRVGVLRRVRSVLRIGRRYHHRTLRNIIVRANLDELVRDGLEVTAHGQRRSLARSGMLNPSIAPTLYARLDARFVVLGSGPRHTTVTQSARSLPSG
jgi:hypothetical protein